MELDLAFTLHEGNEMTLLSDSQAQAQYRLCLSYLTNSSKVARSAAACHARDSHARQSGRTCIDHQRNPPPNQAITQGEKYLAQYSNTRNLLKA